MEYEIAFKGTVVVDTANPDNIDFTALQDYLEEAINLDLDTENHGPGPDIVDADKEVVVTGMELRFDTLHHPVAEDRQVVIDLHLRDDESVREKLTVMNPMEVVYDDARNYIPDKYYHLVNMQPGASLRVTLERVDDLPIIKYDPTI